MELKQYLPDEEKMMKTIKIVGTTKPNEIIEGEIIRNSEDEEKRWERIGIRERGVWSASEEMKNASAFCEFRVFLGLGWSGEDEFGIEWILVVDWVDSEEEHGFFDRRKNNAFGSELWMWKMEGSDV
jgi:hypothetical protein